MIFVTVGHQTPFDRLVTAMDAWAGQHSSIEVFAQIGDGEYIPKHMQYSRWLSAAEFDNKLTQCRAMIAHAGTGTIIKALLAGKAVLVMPRHSTLGETRNDHQIGTARRFAEMGLVLVADEAEVLPEIIPVLEEWQPSAPISESAQPALLERLKQLVEQDESHVRS